MVVEEETCDAVLDTGATDSIVASSLVSDPSRRGYGVMASNSSSAAARKSQVAVAIALQSVNNKEASNANCE